MAKYQTVENEEIELVVHDDLNRGGGSDGSGSELEGHISSDDDGEGPAEQRSRARHQRLAGAARRARQAERCHPHKVGGVTYCYGGEATRRKCVVGPHWPVLMITYTIILGPSYWFLTSNWNGLSPFWKVLSLIVCGNTFLFLFMTAHTDPGRIPKGSADDPERATAAARSPHDTYCDLCHCYRPPGGVHCFDCDACCAGYDHHCPWTGTCIGEGNLRWFYLFVSHIFGFMIYLAVVSAMVFHQPTGRKHGLLI